ncbi:MAG: DNA starvation/stationary phase protection protein Dps [Phormidesmis priestleyi]|uniref:DNA starvation/stationary phase protection protein Dps n=1 Tax=Phormidesmis priestleyi TaxID=268141 RepID=A0A2W4XF29_9CYAN|nr:MAG: DNA starvation/stationary phase protection protein Dps [Phormidesmis priestleyi]
MVSTTSTSAFYPTRLDLPLETRKPVVEMLNTTLAATTDLRTQTKQAHWNVKGKDFYQLHLLFDEMAGELEEFSDMVAERITALAGTAMGTVRMAASASILPEYDFEVVGGMDHVATLADRYAAYAKHLRESINKADELGDQDTNDLYVEISRTIDKRLWFLEAHLVG